MATEAQRYIREHGAPTEPYAVDPALEAALEGWVRRCAPETKRACERRWRLGGRPRTDSRPPVRELAKWDGTGKLSPYADLQVKMTQTYRLLGEECVVIGCTNKIDAPKYVMELIGAPCCMECSQKLALQQLKGGGAPFTPQFEEVTREDIAAAQAAGVTLAK